MHNGSLVFKYSSYFPYLALSCVVVGLIKYGFTKRTVYQFGSIAAFGDGVSNRMPFHLWVVNLLRIVVLIILGALSLRPQLVDTTSQVAVDGIDIMLALDVSGSMQFQDYEDDTRSRVDVAKDEAARFVSLRHDDAVGLVIFGNQAITRCPMTLDKKMMVSLIKDLKIGIIDPDGTVIGRAILAGCNRLKQSQSSTKVLILLTDGEPSQDDIPIEEALLVAKKLGIKIYTIGIGSDKEGYFMDPFFGLRQKPRVNSQLLASIAKATGGSFFMAQSRSDMRIIYDTIDALEKTKRDLPVFTRYQEVIDPYGWYALAFLMVEIIAMSWVWLWI